jgi:hypothetical protein
MMRPGAILVVAFALGACGGASPWRPVIGRGGIQLSPSLPAPTPTPYAALGTKGAGSRSGHPAPTRGAIAPYLRTPRAPRAWAAPPPPVAPSARLSAQPSQPTPKPTLDARPSLTPASVALDAERYASRESRKAEAYRGGDVIVITTTTLLIALLVVLIVVLIT